MPGAVYSGIGLGIWLFLVQSLVPALGAIRKGKAMEWGTNPA